MQSNGTEHSENGVDRTGWTVSLSLIYSSSYTRLLFFSLFFFFASCSPGLLLFFFFDGLRYAAIEAFLFAIAGWLLLALCDQSAVFFCAFCGRRESQLVFFMLRRLEDRLNAVLFFIRAESQLLCEDCHRAAPEMTNFV